jgi:hypothetical protein
MPAEPISMRKLKEILCLKYEAKLSHRKIGASLSISPGTVSTYINRAKLIGIEDWPLPTQWDDIKLNKHFLQTKIQPRTAIPLPNWLLFHPQLKKKGVTKKSSGSGLAFCLIESSGSGLAFCLIEQKTRPDPDYLTR